MTLGLRTGILHLASGISHFAFVRNTICICTLTLTLSNARSGMIQYTLGMRNLDRVGQGQSYVGFGIISTYLWIYACVLLSLLCVAAQT